MHYVQNMHEVNSPYVSNTNVHTAQVHLPQDRMLYLVGDEYRIGVCWSSELAQPQVKDFFPL